MAFSCAPGDEDDQEEGEAEELDRQMGDTGDKGEDVDEMKAETAEETNMVRWWLNFAGPLVPIEQLSSSDSNL